MTSVSPSTPAGSRPDSGSDDVPGATERSPPRGVPGPGRSVSGSCRAHRRCTAHIEAPSPPPGERRVRAQPAALAAQAADGSLSARDIAASSGAAAASGHTSRQPGRSRTVHAPPNPIAGLAVRSARGWLWWRRSPRVAAGDDHDRSANRGARGRGSRVVAGCLHTTVALRGGRYRRSAPPTQRRCRDSCACRTTR